MEQPLTLAPIAPPKLTQPQRSGPLHRRPSTRPSPIKGKRDPENNMIKVWDAKYSTPGRFPDGDSLPITKMDSWSGDIGNAVDSYDGPSADEIRSAYNDGNVSGHYFKYTPGG